MMTGISIGPWLSWRSSSALSEAFSGEPGAKAAMGSLMGRGTVKTALDIELAPMFFCDRDAVFLPGRGGIFGQFRAW